MDRHSGPSSGAQNPQDLQRRIDDLDRQLVQRDRSLRDFEELVERQMGMIERYDSMLNAMPQPSHGSAPSTGFQRDYERLIELVDRAVVRAEQLEGEKHALQAQLERALGLLEESLRKQEQMAANPVPTGAALASMESTLAKYDAILERSLSELERAYSANREKDREIEERDQLISRTLNALETAIEEQERGDDAPRGALFNRLFR